MRIIALSDSHGFHRKVRVPYGDVLIHAGDFTGVNDLRHFRDFVSWFRDQPHEYKILVPGNHDWLCHNQERFSCTMLREVGVVVLIDDSFGLPNGIRIHGSPWTPTFGNWAFMGPDSKGDGIGRKFAGIPDQTDILVTHGPAYGILDMVDRIHVGSRMLLERVQEVQPALHVCGHIHEGYGLYREDETLHANVAICTERYDPTNQPLVFDINNVSGGWPGEVEWKAFAVQPAEVLR